MLYETEIKIRLIDHGHFEVLLNKCKELSEKSVIFVFQRDEYYDTITEDLKHKDLNIRIRKIDGKVYIALKSPRVFVTDKIQRRIELEFEFETSDVNQLMRQIKEQGLLASAIIEKRRWNFEINGCKVAIDEVPYIGFFAEIEGLDRNSIESVLEVLRLSSQDAVAENYGELLEIEFSRLNLPLRPNLRATFSDEYTRQ